MVETREVINNFEIRTGNMNDGVKFRNQFSKRKREKSFELMKRQLMAIKIRWAGLGRN